MSDARFFFNDRRSHLAALLAVIAISAVLRLAHFSGYVGLDDGEYAGIAYKLVNADFSIKEYAGPAVFPLRTGLILPASIAFRMFGLSEWSMVIYPVLLSILALPLVYICATAFFDHRAGFIAVALLGITPVELNSATRLLPDMPAAFFMALGVTAIALMRDMEVRRRSVLFWAGCMAGLSFGLSWLCKEAVAYLAPFCLAYMIMSIRRSSRALLLWGGVAIGSLSILLGEMIVYQYATGDLFFRFHEIERNYRELENGFFTEGSDFGWQKGESYGRALAKRLLVSGPSLIFLHYDFLFLPLVGLVAAFHGWQSKDKLFLVPSLWLVTLILMFNFFSSSLSSYMPLPLFGRYFYPIIFPSVVLASGLMSKLLFRTAEASSEVQRERRFWGTLVGVGLLVIGGYQLQASLRSFPSTWSSEIRSLHSIIEPSSQLYTDTLSRRGLEFFWRYPKKTRWTDFSDIGTADEIQPGSLVLVNKAYINWLNKNAGMWLSPRTGYRKHDFYETPPPHWKRIWQSDNARLYQVQS